MSAPKFTYYSNVKDGQLQMNIRKVFAHNLQHFEGKRVEITLTRAKKKRSKEQNNYIHLLFTIFRDALNDLGNTFTMEDIKDICKLKFAIVDVFNESTGEVIGQKIQETRDMTTTQMCKFVDDIIQWAAEKFEIKLPYPNEEFTLDFGDE